jgi:hypothetical protein
MTNFEANWKLQKLLGRDTSCFTAQFPSGKLPGTDRYGIFQNLPSGKAVGLVASGRTWEGCFNELRKSIEDAHQEALEMNKNG